LVRCRTGWEWVVSAVSVVSVVVAGMVSHGDEVTGSPRGAWWRRAGSTRRHWAHAGNKEKDVGVRQESSSVWVSRSETTHGARCAGGQDRMMQPALGAAVECE
jgi:hypothetical protein